MKIPYINKQSLTRSPIPPVRLFPEPIERTNREVPQLNGKIPILSPKLSS